MSIPVLYDGTEWPIEVDVRLGVKYRLDTLTGTLEGGEGDVINLNLPIVGSLQGAYGLIGILEKR